MASLKKQSKKLKFTNVSGRKKILLITVFAAIVIGVGFIVRSFAATGTLNYLTSNKTLVPDEGAKLVSDTVINGKSASQVVSLYRSSPGGVARADQVLVGGNQKFLLCVTTNNPKIAVFLTTPVTRDEVGYAFNSQGGHPYATQVPIVTAKPYTTGYSELCIQQQAGYQGFVGPMYIVNASFKWHRNACGGGTICRAGHGYGGVIVDSAGEEIRIADAHIQFINDTPSTSTPSK